MPVPFWECCKESWIEELWDILKAPGAQMHIVSEKVKHL